MTPPATEEVAVATALATMSQQIVGLTQTVEHLREDLRRESETYARKDVVETRLTGLDREVRDLKAADEKHTKALEDTKKALEDQANARRIPWTATVAAIAAIAALLLPLIRA